MTPKQQAIRKAYGEKKYRETMKMKKHLSVSIEGILRNYQGKNIDFLEDDDGRILTDEEARAEIARLQALGHKLLPSADCEGFDPFGGGCPGHQITNEG